jgi:putative ABC transport system substrate-binding protein
LSLLTPVPAAEGTLHMIAAFQRGLAEAGHVEGENLAIEYRFTNFRPGLLPEFAGDLVRLKLSVAGAIDAGNNLHSPNKISDHQQ